MMDIEQVIDKTLVFQSLINTYLGRKFSRRCKIGGIWSQRKVNVKCEKDGKILQFGSTSFAI